MMEGKSMQISVRSQTAAQTTLSWQPVAGATHYRVYRSEQADGLKTELGPWQSGQTFHDGSALPAKT